ncbi:phosphopantothenate-cysteine ligase [Blastomyces dermatitidis ATCC 18188]|uniref:Phosphopantothenate-cysteine ligase n=1 Tax=Ajellomyces dermatitidis (strain ATCC 18188 / CBS 674.68) TaxID=653446 RepID=F2TIE9_AJEDA|nr:phosphopantothenate-cysteine ligase [Blastomyces dermatitidis ATCC 18188]
MAKDKERSINPALAQRRLEKAKALKKGKAEVQARRNEKLARRNPDRLQRQIDNLKAVEESGQPLKPSEKQHLEELERDLRAVKKAREALGDKAPTFGGGEARQGTHSHSDRGGRSDGGGRGGVLGKRRRDGQENNRWRRRDNDDGEDSSDTDESVRRIPMPKDTPPPIPRQHHAPRRATNANMEPLGEGRGPGEAQATTTTTTVPVSHPPATQPKPEPKTVYEAAPVIKDLRKEAVSKFVPTVVRMKQEAAKGQPGRLLEPEEMDRLEREGYIPGASSQAFQPSPVESGAATGTGPGTGSPAPNATPPTEVNTSKTRTVQIEDVEDEDI